MVSCISLWKVIIVVLACLSINLEKSCIIYLNTPQMSPGSEQYELIFVFPILVPEFKNL